VNLNTGSSTHNRSQIDMGNLSGSNYWEVGTDLALTKGDTFYIWQKSSGRDRFSIDSNGNTGIDMGSTMASYKLQANGAVAGNSAYVNTSDRRLKQDIQPITGALDKVLALQGVTFNWNKTVNPAMNLDDRNHLGFIAQDVELVLPQAVSTANDAMQTKSLAYGDIVPVLAEAIKELKAENDTLKAQNADILQRLAALEAKLGK